MKKRRKEGKGKKKGDRGEREEGRGKKRGGGCKSTRKRAEEREMREGRKRQRKKKRKEMFHLVFRLTVATVVILRGSST